MAERAGFSLCGLPVRISSHLPYNTTDENGNPITVVAVAIDASYFGPAQFQMTGYSNGTREDRPPRPIFLVEESLFPGAKR